MSEIVYYWLMVINIWLIIIVLTFLFINHFYYLTLLLEPI